MKYSNCCCSVTQSCLTLVTPWIGARQAFLSLTISWSLPKFLSIKLVMPSNRLILCCPLLLLPSIFSSIRVFFSESALHTKWPKYCIFSISPSNEYSGLISFRTDWFDLAVQGTLKSLLQHHSLKASVLRYLGKGRGLPGIGPRPPFDLCGIVAPVGVSSISPMCSSV